MAASDPGRAARLADQAAQTINDDRQKLWLAKMTAAIDPDRAERIDRTITFGVDLGRSVRLLILILAGRST
jgi:hypothetical protein